MQRSASRGRRRRAWLVVLFAFCLVAGFSPASAQAANQCQASSPVSGAYTVTACLSQPTAGATVTGDRTTTATVSTVGTAPGVQKLVFYVDGVYTLTDYEAPYSFALPSTRWGDGSHTVEVEAVMRDGFVSLRGGATVTFNNGITQPPPNTRQFTPTAGTTPAAGKPFVLGAAGDGAGGESSATSVVNLVNGWN